MIILASRPMPKKASSHNELPIIDATENFPMPPLVYNAKTLNPWTRPGIFSIVAAMILDTSMVTFTGFNFEEAFLPLIIGSVTIPLLSLIFVNANHHVNLHNIFDARQPYVFDSIIPWAQKRYGVNMAYHPMKCLVSGKILERRNGQPFLVLMRENSTGTIYLAEIENMRIFLNDQLENNHRTSSLFSVDEHVGVHVNMNSNMFINAEQ